MGFFTSEEAIKTTTEENTEIEKDLTQIYEHPLLELYYEDIMDFMNKYDTSILRKFLINLVGTHKCIIIKELNSNQRYQIYSQCYYPLKFEKIIQKEIHDDDNEYIYKNIKIYNYKIKSDNKNKNKDKDNDKTKNKKNNEDYSEESYENKESDESDKSDKSDESDESYKSESSYEPSVITDSETPLETLEHMNSQQLDYITVIYKQVNTCLTRLNLVIGLNIIGWCLLLFLDPIRVEVEIMEKKEYY